MAEQDDNSRTAKPRLSKLAIVSLFLSVVAVMTMILSSCVVYPLRLLTQTLNAAALVAAVSFILAFYAAIVIMSSERRIKGLAQAIVALLLAGLVADSWLLEQLPRSLAPRSCPAEQT